MILEHINNILTYEAFSDGDCFINGISDHMPIFAIYISIINCSLWCN